MPNSEWKRRILTPRMKLDCSWCEVVLVEVQKSETDEVYVTPFICKSSFEEVFDQGIMVGIPNAYALIETGLY